MIAPTDFCMYQGRSALPPLGLLLDRLALGPGELLALFAKSHDEFLSGGRPGTRARQPVVMMAAGITRC
jgi:hypothetical protein